jgi:hypothetical protein
MHRRQLADVHTNVVLRYVDDPAPGSTADLNDGDRIPDEELEEQSATLAALLRVAPA